MDKRPCVSEEVRDGNTGDEGISGAVFTGGVHHSPEKSSFEEKAGIPQGADQGTGGERRVYRLEAELL